MLWKKTCGKSMTDMGWQHQDGLLVVAEYKRMEETIKQSGYLSTNYWGGQDCRSVEKEEEGEGEGGGGK